LVRVGEVAYGGKVIVKEQEVRIERGLSCLIGPSGLGKSTFLKQLLKGLEWPYVPQEPLLPPSTPEDLASHLASLNKCCEPKKYLTNFLKVLEELGIGYVLGRRVETLSSGERQRLALALQLARDCKKLLADEPTSQLDPRSAVLTMNAIKRWVDTAVIVTHDVSAMGFCDRFFTLRDGLLVPSSPEELGLPWGCLEDCFRSHQFSRTSPSP